MGWFEKTLMIFAPKLIIYYLGRVNERKKRECFHGNLCEEKYKNRKQDQATLLTEFASMFLGVSKKKTGINHAFFRDNKTKFGKKCHTLLCILLLFRIIVTKKKYPANPNYLSGFH